MQLWWPFLKNTTVTVAFSVKYLTMIAQLMWILHKKNILPNMNEEVSKTWYIFIRWQGSLTHEIVQIISAQHNIKLDKAILKDIISCESFTYTIMVIFTGSELHKYRKISNINRTKSQHLDVSLLVLQLYLPNPLKPGVKSRMKMQWSSADRRCSDYIWVINKFTAYWGATYIKGLTVAVV